jgi:UDP-N-acetylmuramoylalanine--D-glutamate ligase
MAKIGLVGWGVETKSAYRYFGPGNDYLIVSEAPQEDFPAQNERLKVQFVNVPRQPGVTSMVEDLSYLDGIENCDKIIYTPIAIKNLQKKFGDDKRFWERATTIQHIFFEQSPTKKIIGVTGSKGKGTTSTLIAKLLEGAGKKVYLGGNIGLPPLDFIHELTPDSWVVLELANFQLFDFPYSPHIAVCLMIVPEHMDWHKDMGEYIEAKANIFKHQSQEDFAIYFAQDESSTKIAGYSPAKKIPYFQKPGAYISDDGTVVVGEEEAKVIKTSELKLLGRHNWQNVCAAVTAVWQITQDVEAMRKVLTTFSGLEHRLEFVRELDGVKYYDDSFATTPQSAVVALSTFSQPVVLVAGGWDKGLDMTPFVEQITQKGKVRHSILIGQIAPKMAKELSGRTFTDFTEGLEKMPDIVAAARSKAQPGDVVLLSCGTSSFGLFKDYKDRGDQFKQAVKALA